MAQEIPNINSTGSIRTASEVVTNAVQQIKDLQHGRIRPIVTRYDHFNNSLLGGIFHSLMITISALSGVGKTFFLQTLEEDVFNKELNPLCDDYVLLRCTWEMSVMRLLLRRMKRELNMKIRDILLKIPSDELQERMNEIFEKEKDGRIFYQENAVHHEKFERDLVNFLEVHKHKKHILVTIDHVGLVEGNDKQSMDRLMAFCNKQKKLYPVSFIFLMQMNRGIRDRTELKTMAPRQSDLYSTSNVEHISDLICIIQNPYKRGIEKYMSVKGGEDAKYSYLSEFMLDASANWTSFSTKGNLFYHYLKRREMEDDEVHMDLFIEKLFPNQQKELADLEESYQAVPESSEMNNFREEPDWLD